MEELKEYTEENTWWCLHTTSAVFRISPDTVDKIMGILRTHVGPGTPLVQFLDIFGSRCQVNMGHVECWYESTPESRSAQSILLTRLNRADEQSADRLF